MKASAASQRIGINNGNIGINGNQHHEMASIMAHGGIKWHQRNRKAKSASASAAKPSKTA
jgi:hypothetical protein